MTEEEIFHHAEGGASNIVRTYCTLMDHVLPDLPPAEHVVLQRLFRLSYVQQQPSVQCRYDTLARQCGISLRTLQRALRSLKQKKLVNTTWHSHGATTFALCIVLSDTGGGADRKRQRHGRIPSPLPTTPEKPPIYDTFSDEDRELFLTGKRSLSPVRLNQLTETAVEWLTERCGGDPNGFSDLMLRDKVDELVSREIFGPERQARYAHLFRYLYTITTDIRSTV